MANASKFIDLIGKTPLVDLTSLTRAAQLYAKCEFLNPSFSMKDRIAKYILEMAEATNQLKPDDTIVCSSSGNTGCSIAMLGAIKGYSVIIVVSDKCSMEKQNHIKSFNATLIVVDERDYVEYGKKLAQDNDYFDVNQYDNPYNPETYYKTLGPEIWKETNGKITHFVMTGSTFGCISGTAKFLKEKKQAIQVTLADPLYSNIHSYYYNGYLKNNPQYQPVATTQSYLIEGAGKQKPTQCLDFSVIDEVLQVSDQEAISTCHKLAEKESLFVGGSSGINVFAATIVANRLKREDVVVTVLADNGIKYLSKIYDSRFLTQNKIKTSYV